MTNILRVSADIWFHALNTYKSESNFTIYFLIYRTKRPYCTSLQLQNEESMRYFYEPICDKYLNLSPMHSRTVGYIILQS